MIQKRALETIISKNKKSLCFVLIFFISISIFFSFSSLNEDNDFLDISYSMDNNLKKIEHRQSYDDIKITSSSDSDISKTNDCGCAESVQTKGNSKTQNIRPISIEELRQRKEIENWSFNVSDNSGIFDYSIDSLCGFRIQEKIDDQDFSITEPKFNSNYEDLPDSFDWRDHGSGLPPIRNQGSCGSCWAFGTLSPLECNIWLTDGERVDLSEQWLLSCNKDGYSCNGGWWAHDYLKENGKSGKNGGNGAVFEEDFPYTARDDSCKNGLEHEYFIDDWNMFSGQTSEASVEDIKQAIYEYGPISAAVHVSSSFQSYSGGIFDNDVNSQCNHAITLVGWNDNQGSNGVWILRNSWGTSWGENGYMRIEYSCSKVGTAATYVDYKGGVTVIDLDYSPKSIDFGDMYKAESDSTNFEIWNNATEEMQYSLSEDYGWLSISPTEGSSSSGEKDTITVDVDTSGLEYGSYTCGIEIESNARNAVLNVYVNVVSHPPDLPVDPKPENNAKGVDINPTLSINVSDIDNDSLTVTFYDESDDSVIDSVSNVESGDTATVFWENLDYDKKYSWYVVSDDGFAISNSDVFSFITNSPPVISNMYPEDGSTDVSLGIDNLTVDIVDPDGDNIDWSITTKPDVGSSYVGDDFIGDKSCEVSELMPDTTYTWTVIAVDSRGATSESLFTFKTMKNIPPQKPIVILPNDGGTDVSIISNLNWSCTDPDGDKGLIYDIYFGKNNDPPLLEEGVSDSFYKVTYDLELSTTYYWKIVATDRFGASVESSVFSFTTTNDPPPPKPGDIDIGFYKKLSYAGVKADIVNVGVRDVSNVIWEVTVTGGVFDKVNMSKSGCISRLNLDEKQLLSTRSFLDFERPFGFGKIKTTIEISNELGETISRKTKDGFLFFQIIIFLD